MTQNYEQFTKYQNDDNALDGEALLLYYIPVHEVLLWQDNAKKHDIGAIIQSIEQNGFRDPPAWDNKLGGLVEGNGRAEALIKMQKLNKKLPRGILKHREDDYWCMPVLFGIDAKSQAAATRYAIDHNNLTMAGGEFTIDDMSKMWDKERYISVLQGIEDEVMPISFGDMNLSDLIDNMDDEDTSKSVNERTDVEEDEPPISRAEELRQQWNTEYGQMWIIPTTNGEHRILCGDSTNPDDVKRVMKDDLIELIWTDPPYGVAIGDKNKFLNKIAKHNRIEKNLTNDTLDEDGLYDMLCKAFDNAIAHSKPGAAFYVASPAGPLHIVFGQVLKERGIWRQTIQWVKNSPTFSPMGVDYHWKNEPIFYGWIPNAGHRYHGGRQQNTVWEIDRPMKSEEHPTMKPVALVARAIENSTLTGEIVYDCFGGSGTTMAASEQLGRLCRAIEIDPGYVAVILERMTNAGLEPMLAE